MIQLKEQQFIVKKKMQGNLINIYIKKEKAIIFKLFMQKKVF